jgi:hypothetical protein
VCATARKRFFSRDANARMCAHRTRPPLPARLLTRVRQRVTSLAPSMVSLHVYVSRQCICMCVCECVCVSACVCVYVCMYVYIHTYIHTYIYI